MSEDQKAMVPGDPQPTNAQEYMARFMRNQKITGYGFEVTMHYPCPFCAAPNFKVERVLDTEKSAGKESVCSECGRGMAVILTKSEDGLSSMMTMRQTRGDDPPDWMQPKIPRAVLDPVVPPPPKEATSTVAHEHVNPGGVFNIGPIEFSTHPRAPNMTCTYCGSSHPKDVAEAVRKGARLEVADLKYGWPHKVYLHDIPEDMRGMHLLKFYTEHLQDALPDDRDTIERAIGLKFKFNAGRVEWRNYHPGAWE